MSKVVDLLPRTPHLDLFHPGIIPCDSIMHANPRCMVLSPRHVEEWWEMSETEASVFSEASDIVDVRTTTVSTKSSDAFSLATLVTLNTLHLAARGTPRRQSTDHGAMMSVCILQHHVSLFLFSRYATTLPLRESDGRVPSSQATSSQPQLQMAIIDHDSKRIAA